MQRICTRPSHKQKKSGSGGFDEAERIVRDKAERDPANIQGPADYCDTQRLQDLIDELAQGILAL